jgi:hypothetical protein
LPPLPPDDDLASAPADDVLAAPLRAARPDGVGTLCPVDRLPRRRRNQICIIIIALGLANFLVYTLTYAALGGDARNGELETVTRADGSLEVLHKVRGHFIHSLSGAERVVSRGAWIYSYVHSISLPLTSAATLISMLILARPHILATMRGGWVSGQTFVTAFGTIVLLVALAVAATFTWGFVEALTSA